jgi:hypothetical protein
MNTHTHDVPTPAGSAAAQPDAPRVVVVTVPGRQTGLWLIAVLLAVIATATVLRWDEASLTRSASAQALNTGAGPGASARGIYAFTGQLDSHSFGLFMLDVDSGTVWCYEMVRNRSSDPMFMRLVAARYWIYDRYLEEFNVASPTPTEVRQLVEQQRTARQVQATQPAGAIPPPGSAPAGGLKLPASP